MGLSIQALHVGTIVGLSRATLTYGRGHAELAEAELISLHEGNFARYRIRPSEFATWRQVWEAR